MMKKNILIAIAALFTLGQGAWAQASLDNLRNAGDGKTYFISSAADLNVLAAYVNEGYSCDGLTFQLTADITYTDTDNDEFTPIGYGDYYFQGTFDGKGFTISGIHFSDPEGVGVGLFGYIYHPVLIMDLKLDNCSFTGNECVGAIAGMSEGFDDNDDSPSGIMNCTVGSGVTVTAVAATIEGEEYPGAQAGGIIGNCTTMTISNCISAAKVTGDENVGGIAGSLKGHLDFAEPPKEYGVIDNCYFTGTVNGTSKNAIGIRGLEETDYTEGLIRISLYADDSSKDIKNLTRLENFASQQCDVTVDGMTLKKDGKWHTICLPFYSESIPGLPLDGASLLKLSNSSYDSGTLTLEFEEEKDIPVIPRPYLAKWESDKNITNPTFTNVKILESSDGSGVFFGNAGLLGILSSTTIDADDRTVLLVNDENKLYYPEEVTTLDAFNAYFELADDLPAGTASGVTEYVVKNGETVLMSGSFEVSTPTLTLTLYDNADNSAAITEANGKVCDVTLSGRTLYKDGKWNTLCLPFKVSNISESPLAGATVKTLSSSSYDDGKLKLNFSDVLTSLEAGKPYLLKWSAGDNVTDPSFTGVTIVGETTDISTDYVVFKGSYSPKPLTAGDKTILYMGSDDKLYYPTASFNINAFRGYFMLNGITAEEISSTNAIILNFGDDATGIAETSSFQSQAPNQKSWFSLDGRRLNGQPTAKGVYINNGKKMVIK